MEDIVKWLSFEQYLEAMAESSNRCDSNTGLHEEVFSLLSPPFEISQYIRDDLRFLASVSSHSSHVSAKMFVKDFTAACQVLLLSVVISVIPLRTHTRLANPNTKPDRPPLSVGGGGDCCAASN